MLLTTNNIKSELSYAYLHAVAARGGFECVVAGRHSDGAGVDAILRVKERFSPESVLTDFTVEIQLKATSAEPSVDDRGRYSFIMELDHYDKLRNIEINVQRLMVVLYLPQDEEQWLRHTDESLIARRCAYWVSLYGAPASQNATKQTVYIPQSNRFSVESLRGVMARLSFGERISYEL